MMPELPFVSLNSSIFTADVHMKSADLISAIATYTVADSIDNFDLSDNYNEWHCSFPFA
jgi:hypothetical protein